MSIPIDCNTAGEWLKGTGPNSDIVLSTRIRLARNISGHLFVNRATRRQQQEILARCRDQFSQAESIDSARWIDINQSSDLDRQLLVERHLVSRQHARNDIDLPRGVAVGSSETLAIMVNEEDHLRIQVLRSGMQLNEAFDQINRIDDELEDQLEYAFNPQWGYLTACPTNVGTGIRVSVMMHLPALKLTGEIEKVRRAAREMHLAVRGLFGEGSDALGDLYQVSNQTTLGRPEEEILADFQHTVIPQIIAYEQQARQALLRQRPTFLDDKVWRAWGLLTHAKLLGTDEVLQFLSHLRLGVNLGRLDRVDIPQINQLFLFSQPGHLQQLTGCKLDQNARREARATLIRDRLTAR